MSGRETTAREPRDRGCSGSEIVEMRSEKAHEDWSVCHLRFGQQAVLGGIGRCNLSG